MSTQDVHAVLAPAQKFHPEFGYLCPSLRLRRQARGAVVTVLAAMVIAAGAALALSPQLVPQSEGVGQEASLSAAPVPAMSLPALPVAEMPVLPIDKAAGLADENVPAARAPAALATQMSAATRAQAACDDLSGSFLAPGCQLGKAGKSRQARTARAARSRVAGIQIGRADAAFEAGSDRAEAPPPTPIAESAAVAANAAAPVQAAERPAAPAKKPVKTAPKPTPGRDIATAEAAPAAPAPGFGPFGLFHEPPRTASGAWAMSW